MTTDHDAIQELLAAHALRVVADEDAARAQRILGEHLPVCEICRDTMQAFEGLAGDLALATDPVEPPDLLLARLHRDMDAGGPQARRVRTGWIAAVAAGFILLIGVAGSALLGGAGTSATLAAADLRQAVAAAEKPGAQTNDLGAVVEVSLPDHSGFYLWGEDVPQPPPGQVYRLWLVSGTQAYYVGEFAPDATGVVAIQVEVDGDYDEVFVTTEALEASPTPPAGA